MTSSHISILVCGGYAWSFIKIDVSIIEENLLLLSNFVVVFHSIYLFGIFFNFSTEFLVFAKRKYLCFERTAIQLLDKMRGLFYSILLYLYYCSLVALLPTLFFCLSQPLSTLRLFFPCTRRLFLFSLPILSTLSFKKKINSTNKASTLQVNRFVCFKL